MSRMVKIAAVMMLLATPLSAARQMESLGRGVVAVRTSSQLVYVGWRLLGTDPADIAFNLYRDATKLNAVPITGSTNYLDATPWNGTYTVRTVIAGKERQTSEPAEVWTGEYHAIALRTPEGYSPNDASVADLDGDGEYEIVLHQTGASRDNSQSGFTDPPILQAYKLDGSFLWEINLGINIREGAHYTQFMVYDLDGDGRAEVACKTADGTVDGTGVVIGNAGADYPNDGGYILRGPEFLTIFDGRTGAALATTPYVPGRGNVCDWGDCYGNRVDRFLACVAYLDGERPSLVMCRGYYTRAVLVAWNYRDGELKRVWTFDSDDGTPGNSDYRGQGNHNLSVGDIDGDGRDEIVYGACAIDDDGTGLYSTGWGHGDAMHLSDLDPDTPGLEVFQAHGDGPHPLGAAFRDAGSGDLLWGRESTASGGVGRAVTMDLDPRHRGYECWAAGGISGLYSAQGSRISSSRPDSINMGVWWDDDVLREVLDGTTIDDWDYTRGREVRLLSAHQYGCASNNGTKANPSLCADILGDWREEVIWRSNDNQELRLFTTTIPTNMRYYTFMHDPVYRLSVAWQNVAYNQPTQTGFFMGADMEPPPVPDIVLAGSDNRTTFVRGDFNIDGGTDIGDALSMLLCIFRGTGCSSCTDAMDANDDSFTDVSDPIYLLHFLFVGGPPLPAPSATCGTDPSADELDCPSFSPCSG